MINNANKALGYAEVYYNYRTEKFFTDAVGSQFLELDITFAGGGSSGVNSITAGNGISVDPTTGNVTITADPESSTLDDVTGRGSTTTNDISIGRLTASKIGLPSLSALPTTNLNFGDLCALTSDNRPYFYDGSNWRKLYLVDVPPAAGDPDTDWDQVILRLTFDTNLADQSDNSYNAAFDANYISRVGSPKKFGTHSAKLEQGRLSYSSVPNFLTSAFTIEFWLYLDTHVSGSSNTHTVSLFEYGSTRFQYVATNGSNTVTFRFTDSDGTQSFGNFSFSTQTWRHITFSRNATSGVITFYIDGTAKGTVSGNNISSTTSSSMSFGDAFRNDYFIDDVRISSFERYTTGFNPPTAALPTSD